jgi:hypothetical protein
MKLKLKLNQSELQVLQTHLFLSITSQPIEHLCEEPIDYLVCSVLKDVLDRANAKIEDIRRFPTKRTDATYTVSLSRSEALAIACSLNFDMEIDGVDPKALMPYQHQASYEEGFFRSLYGDIHRTYLI